jgi:hypothetical protein
MTGWLKTTMSLCVPGAGQALSGALLEAGLWFTTCVWLRLVLSGQGWRVGELVEAESGFWFGAFGISGSPPPVAWMFTAALVTCHILSAWDARRQG